MAESSGSLAQESVALLTKEITTRRLRLVYLNLLLVLVPIAAVVLFVVFGMSDRKFMTNEIHRVVKEVNSQIPKTGDRTTTQPTPGTEKVSDSEPVRQELEKQRARLDETSKSVKILESRTTVVESYGKRITALEAGETARNAQNVDRLEKAFLAFRSDVLTILDRLNKGLQGVTDVKPDIERIDKAVQALKGLPGSVDGLAKRLDGVEADLKTLRASTTTRFEAMEKTRTEHEAILKELSRRLDLVAGRSLGFVILREKEVKAIPGLGISVHLGEVEGDALNVKLVRDEKKVLYDNQVVLEREVAVNDVPCAYRLTLSRVRKANAFQKFFGQRDYLEVHLQTDPACKTS